jgi:hypothetical protein
VCTAAILLGASRDNPPAPGTSGHPLISQAALLLLLMMMMHLLML